MKGGRFGGLRALDESFFVSCDDRIKAGAPKSPGEIRALISGSPARPPGENFTAFRILGISASGSK